MNINIVTYPIFDQKCMLSYKKTIFSKIFPSKCLFSLLKATASTDLFETKKTSKKSYFSLVTQSYYWFIFMIFF